MNRKLNLSSIKDNTDLMLVLFITLILYSIGLYTQNLSAVILDTLLFLILLEFVRTIRDYAFTKKHIIRVDYILDAGVLFGLRELFTGWLMLKTDLIVGVFIMLLSVVTTGILLFYRKYAKDCTIRQSTKEE